MIHGFYRKLEDHQHFFMQEKKKNRQDFYENHINHIFGAFLKSLDPRGPSESEQGLF